MTSVILALIGLANCCVLTAGFAYLGHVTAKERKMLINAALSRTSTEFAIRQQASAESTPVEDSVPMYFPEGL